MSVDQTSAIETVHKLLFRALLEIRSQGHDGQNKVVFHLADLFHNAVLQLESVDENGSGDSYADVLTFIRQRAKEKGCEAWVDAKLQELQAKSVAG